MVFAPRPLGECQGTTVQALGLAGASLLAHERGEGVQGEGDQPMLRPEALLFNREQPTVQDLGFAGASLLVDDRTEQVERAGNAGVVLAPEPFANGEGMTEWRL